MGHLFQVECWEKTSQCGCSSSLLRLRKLAKEITQDLERQSDINWHFIFKNNGNQEKMKVKGHRLHVRSKMKENNAKIKIIEATLIKRLMRINW